MSVPNVAQILFGGISYCFNGWVGKHSITNKIVFEFTNGGKRKIWVDVNGKFVCKA